MKKRSSAAEGKANEKNFGSSQILVQYHIIAARSVFFNKVLFKKLAVVPENSKFIVTKKTKAYNGNNR